ATLPVGTHQRLLASARSQQPQWRQSQWGPVRPEMGSARGRGVHCQAPLRTGVLSGRRRPATGRGRSFRTESDGKGRVVPPARTKLASPIKTANVAPVVTAAGFDGRGSRELAGR